MNGRMSDIYEQSNTNFNISKLYDEKNKNLDTYKNEALNHLFYDNKVNVTFFSVGNINLLQDTIINEVYKKTNYNIKRQSDRELLIVMKSIYLEYSRNNDDILDEEIKYLNDLVLNSIIPSIISNLYQYLGYLKDISTEYIPMDNPVLTKDDPSLEYNKF